MKLLNKPFTESVIKLKTKPKLKNPIFVTGLPGVGLVSKLTADNLIKVTKAKHYGTLYSPHFPNQVLTLENGRIRVFAIQLYHGKIGKRDIVITKGDLQPMTVEGQYEVSTQLLSYFAALGGGPVISMAGYAVNHSIESPGVFAASTSKKLIQELVKAGAKPSGRVIPVIGMAGLLPAYAKLYGLKGACLLVETPGPIVDAKGAIALTSVLAKYMKTEIGTDDLAKRAKKTAKAVAEFERQQAEAAKANAPPALPGQLSYIH